MARLTLLSTIADPATNLYTSYPQLTSITCDTSCRSGQALAFPTPPTPLETILVQDVTPDEKITFIVSEAFIPNLAAQQPQQWLFNGTQAAQFVEISAEIEMYGYQLGDTNSIAKAKPRTITVVCVTGPNQWYMTNDVQQPQQWLFNGTNVMCRTEIPSKTGQPDVSNEVWESSDGHPLGHWGVNIPWLAFCSGNYLKHEGRLIPLPADVLRHCPDRFAYTDVTTKFDDELGLPRTVDLFSSQRLFLKSHTDWDKELCFGNRYTEWNQKTAMKIQEGLLVCHYAVLQSTNVIGQNFPTKFEFFQSGRPYEQMGNWFCSGIGRVNSIRPSTNPPAFK